MPDFTVGVYRCSGVQIVFHCALRRYYIVKLG